MSKLSFDISNMTALSQIVDMINNSTEFDAEDIAAQYAVYEEDEVDIYVVENNLDVLVNAGAEFDYQEAVQRALNN